MYALIRKFARLRPSEDGSVAPLIGLTIMALLCAVGVAVDLGRGQVAQSKLQASLDSAGLAAGSLVSQDLTQAELEEEAAKYLYSNFAGETVDAVIDDFDVTPPDENNVLVLTATGELPTTIMQIFGKRTMQIAARTEITREMRGLEIALVLDVTGSMCMDPPTCAKLTDLKEAATDLINILFGNQATVDDLWVGIVPFSASVNVGTSRSSWAADYAARTAKDNCVGPTTGTPHCTTATALSPTISLQTPSKPPVSTHTSTLRLVDDWMIASPTTWYFKPHSWGGCFEERYDTGDDVTNATPEDSPFRLYFYPDMGSNDWLNNSNGNRNINTSGTSNDRSANMGCPRQSITTLTNTKSTLTTAITNLQAITMQRTHIPVGAVWGWRLLSPEWRTVWGGDMEANGLPLEYVEELSNKAVVIMTDGQNTMTDYTAYGRVGQGNLGATDLSNASQDTMRDTLNDKTLEVCSAMKERGIIVYTVLFQETAADVRDMLRSCASEEDYFFDTTTGADLKTAFRTIGDSLSNLRISK